MGRLVLALAIGVRVAARAADDEVAGDAAVVGVASDRGCTALAVAARMSACTLACVAGAMWFATGLPKTYEARARVLMEVMQPDLVTGTMISTRGYDAYVRTQQILATGERVALRVVQKLGWAQNPAVIDAFTGQTGGVGDIDKWAAQRIMSSAGAVPLENTATLEIIYQASDPEAASTIARLLRESYIEVSLALLTEASARRAERYDVATVEARKSLATAEAALTKLQRETGVVTNAAGADIERNVVSQLRDRALNAEVDAAKGAVTGLRRPRDDMTTAALRRRINVLDQQILSMSTQAGDENPTYQMLLRQRDNLQRQVQGLEVEARAGAGSAAALAQVIKAQTEADYRAERARLYGRAETYMEVEHAAELVQRRRAELTRLLSNAATARLQADRTESGLVVMGDVIASPEPVAPNFPVIATIAALFGLALGLSSVLIDGLWGREVLGAEDLSFASGVPVLGVVPGDGRKDGWFDALRRRFRTRRAAPAT